MPNWCVFCQSSRKTGIACPVHGTTQSKVERSNWRGSKYYPAEEKSTLPNCTVSGCAFQGKDWEDLISHLGSHLDEETGGKESTHFLSNRDKKDLENLYLSFQTEGKKGAKAPKDPTIKAKGGIKPHHYFGIWDKCKVCGQNSSSPVHY